MSWDAAFARHSQHTLTICLGEPGLLSILPHHLIQLTTKWLSVDSSALVFTRHTAAHLVTPLQNYGCAFVTWGVLVSCALMDMVFIIDKLWFCAQKSNNRLSLRFRSGQPCNSVTFKNELTHHCKKQNKYTVYALVIKIDVLFVLTAQTVSSCRNS